MGLSQLPQEIKMRRFFVPPEEFSKDIILISGPDAHHLKNVLRLKAGDQVIVFDGCGSEYLAAILAVDRETVRISLQMPVPQSKTEQLRISIGQALLRSQKMDLVMQKITELGAHAVYPFTCRRSVPIVSSRHMEEKRARWERISIAASKQCGRNILPSVHPVQPFSSVLAALQGYDLKLILWEKTSDINLKSVLAESLNQKMVCALIGPEGGFSDSEFDESVKAGFVPVGLGKHILRAETATLAIMSIIRYELGWC